MFLSVVIPTFGREEVLLQTIQALLALKITADEIIIIDQTLEHQRETYLQLEIWKSQRQIRWIRMEFASITRAMNTGLRYALGERVLFLDDDIIPDDDLILTHRESAIQRPHEIIAGRVLQPWHQRLFDSDETNFLFNSPLPRYTHSFMGGNVNIPRRQILEIGGFDTNFVRVAYHFEAELAHRWLLQDGSIYYEPDALIHHLRAERGGTRSYGDHLRTSKPDHAVGKFYYYFCTSGRAKAVFQSINALLKSVVTKHHLLHPLWIPITLTAESTGLAWALILYFSGRGLIDSRGIRIQVPEQIISPRILTSHSQVSFPINQRSEDNCYFYQAGTSLNSCSVPADLTPRSKSLSQKGDILSRLNNSVSMLSPEVESNNLSPRPEVAFISDQLNVMMLPKFVLLLLRNIPIVYIATDSFWEKRRPNPFLVKYYLNKSSLILVTSERSRDFMHDHGVSSAKIIYSGDISSHNINAMTDLIISAMNMIFGRE